MSYLCHRAHKYVAKIKGAGPGGKTLYFYTQEAYQGYLKSKTRKADAIKSIDADIAENDETIKEDMNDLARYYGAGDKKVNNLGDNYQGSKYGAFMVTHITRNAWNKKVSEVKKARLQKRYKVTRAGTNKAVSDTGTRSALPGDRLKSKSITRATKRRRKEERRRRAAMELDRR